MAADRIHLVRHGEVHNPQGVLYGRLPNFGLSDLGHEMALRAANELAALNRPIRALFVSPLQRTRESARPISQRFGLDPVVDERFIEPTNRFEGTVLNAKNVLSHPKVWPSLRNPWQPSWGEPYEQIAARMLAAMEDAYDALPGGDVVVVSHQLPIWMVHSKVAGKSLPHWPGSRRCSLSSITSFEKRDGRWVEVDYRDPSADLRSRAKDVGAV